jgi:hypothetical protein
VDLQKARDPATGLYLPAWAGDSLRIEMFASPLLLNVLDPVIVTGTTPQQIGSTALVTDVREPRNAPGAALRFDRVSPSPARRAVSFAFTAEGAHDVTLRVTDARGRVVRTVASGVPVHGPRVVVWDGYDDAGRAVPSGVYHAILSSARGDARARVVLAR